jgi:hypothetical protein
VCVNTDEDPDHCGDCATRCGHDELCSSGHCGVGCFGGTMQCGERCVQIDNDPDHCGSCDTACDTGEVCSKGRCGLECVGGTELCGAACADLAIDPRNCGSCGNACAEGEVCSDGRCGTSCGSRLACDGKCVNSDTDRNNCGDCGHACAEGQVCSSGVCGTTCENSVLCGHDCTDLLTDSANCGGCGHACGTGQKCENGACGLFCAESSLVECNGKCVDTQSDGANCGSCFATCGTGYLCRSGACACDGGLTKCSGTCVDTNADVKNCGVCGVACAVNEACKSGTCDCRDGTTRCGNDCIDTSVSAANCGGCDKPCAAGSVCTDGACAAPTSDWPTFQHDVAHTGVNSNETGGPPLTLAWSRPISASAPAAIAGGRVFLTTSSYFGTMAPLQVLNASDGSDLWSYNFGEVFSVGAPSVFDGTVYLANGKGTESPPPYLWSFDAASGNINWTARMDAQWEHYWAPIRVGDIVYTNAGEYGGLYGFAAADGAQKFFLGLDQYDSWSAAYFSGNIYTFIAGNFRKHDPVSGAVLNTVTIDWNWDGYSMDTAPVFGGSYAYVVAPPNLVAIDPVANKVAWTSNGTYTGTPAVDGDLVYGLSAGTLVVRSASSGALAWTFVGDGGLEYPPVIAGDYVYVASANNVYAVSQTTHTAAWTDKVGGWLSLAARRLIVVGSSAVTAYVLSP